MTSRGRLGSGEHVHPPTGIDPTSSPTSSVLTLETLRLDLSGAPTNANPALLFDDDGPKSLC